MNKYIFYIAFVVLPFCSKAQNDVYTLDDCINYAFEQSIDIGRAQNSQEIQGATLEQSKAERLPNLQLGFSQQLGSTSSYDSGAESWERSGNSNFNSSLSSQLTIYQGAKLKNTILQNGIEYQASEYNVQTEKEMLSLNILNAYVNVLLTKENVLNAQLQYESTEEQLAIAQARREAGAIALTDVLNIQSELASNKSLFVQAQSNERIALVSLMQLMNMPLNNAFNIEGVPVDELLNKTVETNSNTVYQVALGLQPNIQNAELLVQSAEKSIQIAKADALPQVTLEGGISSSYSSNIEGVNFGEQVSEGISPNISLNVSIPIFQRKQVKTQVKIAQIEAENTNLYLEEQKLFLRQYIEQACVDAITAQSNYQASKEQLMAETESYAVATEMFQQGMMNAVDYLISKNNYMLAENQFTQSQYTLILQSELIEYYMGQTISL